MIIVEEDGVKLHFDTGVQRERTPDNVALAIIALPQGHLLGLLVLEGVCFFLYFLENHLEAVHRQLHTLDIIDILGSKCVFLVDCGPTFRGAEGRRVVVGGHLLRLHNLERSGPRATLIGYDIGVGGNLLDARFHDGHILAAHLEGVLDGIVHVLVIGEVAVGKKSILHHRRHHSFFPFENQKVVGYRVAVKHIVGPRPSELEGAVFIHLLHFRFASLII